MSLNQGEEKRSDYPSILEKIEELREDFRAWQVEMRLLLHGNGDENRPGMVVRLDRIEREIHTFKTVLTRIWIVIGTAIAGVIVKWLNVIEHLWKLGGGDN